ncbi:hypothetical protein P9112_005602 [Eukaryota sp. TZLM1-RC]
MENTMESPPRLVVSKMVLENFKSYAGVQQIGPFHKSFSAIVGPNGSGKSNVIDALLFVFGYRAKKLRLNNLNKLIHTSSAFPDATFARVSVFFEEIVDDSEGSYHPVPNSEFCISRTVQRKGSSSYHINNSASTFSAVRELLSSKGLDLEHNRFLILQGEVESISQMKPKATSSQDGLLEYLEDIIGTSSMIEEIENTANEVIEQEKVHQSIERRQKEAQVYLDNLKKQKDLAEKFVSTRMDLSIAQHHKKQIETVKLNTDLEEVGVGIESLTTELQAKSAELASVNTEDQSKKIEEEYEQLRGQIDRISHEVKALQEEKKGIDTNLAVIKEKRSKLESKNNEFEEQLRIKGNEINGCNDLIKRKSRKLEKINSKKSENSVAFQLAKEEEQKAINELGSTAGEYIEQMNKQKALMAPFTERIMVLEEEIKGLNIDKSDNEAKISKVEADLEAIRLKGKETSDAINQIEQTLKENDVKIKEAHKEGSKIPTEITKLERIIASSEQELATVTSDLVRLQETETAQKSSSSVMNCLEEGVQKQFLTGVYGRLGDLGSVDESLRLACSAATSALDHVVVDSVADAEACIDYLKRNGAGRATFIVLEKVNKDQERFKKGKKDVEQGVSRLVDLVRCEPPFKLAFFYAFKNTLLCKDINSARSIAFAKRPFRRVVTLKGEVIEPSGAMVGGGQGKVRIKIGSEIVENVDPGEILRLEEQVRTLTTTISEYRTQLGSLKERLENLERFVNAARTENQTLQPELESLKKHFKDLKAAHHSESGTSSLELKELKAQNASLVNAIQQKQSSIHKIKEESCNVTAEIERLETCIKKSGGETVDAFQDVFSHLEEEKTTMEEEERYIIVTLDEAKNSVEKKSKEVNEIEVKKGSNMKEIARLNDQLAQLNPEKSRLLEALEEKQASYDLENAKLNKLQEQYDICVQQKEEQHQIVKRLEKELSSLQSQRSKIISRMNQLVNSMLELENEYTDARNCLFDPEFFPPNISMIPTDLDSRGMKKFENRVLASIQKFSNDLEESQTDIRIIEDYKKAFNDNKKIQNEFTVITATLNELQSKLAGLKDQRLKRFLTGFSAIGKTLREIYQMVTYGGDAELELVDSLDPFSEGIVFSVRPPKKSWKTISNLSGGEKTLSSLALIFALHSYKRNPIYVLDEIDAALDFRNVAIVAAYLTQKTKDAQFIVISLRNDMFEMAQRLVGIYKINDMTESVVLDPAQVGTMNN